MNIVVCVKQVVDTEAVIALDGAGEVELTGQTMVIDPYSEFAVERAVQLKEELGGTVTLLTLGSQDCLAAVRHGLAMGADAAVLIEDDQWTARDAAQAAALLAEAASTMGADLVMGGWKSGDTAAAQVMGVRPLLHLANLTEADSFSGELAHALLSSPEARTRLADHLMELLHRNGYRGIDVDLESIFPEDAKTMSDPSSYCGSVWSPWGIPCWPPWRPKPPPVSRENCTRAMITAAWGKRRTGSS